MAIHGLDCLLATVIASSAHRSSPNKSLLVSWLIGRVAAGHLVDGCETESGFQAVTFDH
jgi:hypothetical protein